MDISHIIDPLNDAQREAVCAPDNNALVLAGAGSGKTRVLVHRIAWLMQAENISPWAIMAVTFTNKAAGEMRGRIERLLGIPAGGLWVGTFHGIAHRLLRAHWKEAGLPQTFQIMDSEDQLRAVKRVTRDMGLDESQWPPKESQWYINARKDEGLRPQHIDHHGDMHKRYLIEIYTAYEAFCQNAGLLDFAELLLRAHELWLQRPDVLQHYQERFRHILVDEFQDTNTIQYAWLRMLAGKRNKLFAVGDDDQSIYGWRGARVENLHQFNRDFPDSQTFRLEQNYRSTGTILNAANALIANNAERLGKNLWTTDSEGEPIQLYAAFNELDEAHYIVERIQSWVDKGGLRSECALLYRSNAQSRVLEEILVRAGMPYRVYGGLRFFERQEIKDALAYLRLIENRADDASFERIVNVPTRGIGNRTLDVVREYAKTNGVTRWQAAHAVVEQKELSARAIGALHVFLNLIQNMADAVQAVQLHEQIEHVIHAGGLIQHYQKEKGEKGRARIENLEELINAGRNYNEEDINDELTEGMTAMQAFLAHAALEAGEAQGSEWDDCVQLMTLHSAKGLEFKQVFMCGVEEGLFPHKFSIDEPGRLEEERRLCYVGITRAREHLTICYAEKRRLYGEETYARPSRFINEIPAELLEEVRLRGTITQPVYNKVQENSANYNTGNNGGLQLGQRVIHDKFGEGVVLNYEGNGRHARVQVNFYDVGSKWLMMEYANLRVG
ncbi:MAG: DNA helicase II [Gammaproteobacteria bacterium]|nr:DNA helicase II [Gammaproteobacteria bacterium]MDH5650755.1 DNA helicase II [Gammaproteobacteria bacterium]